MNKNHSGYFEIKKKMLDMISGLKNDTRLESRVHLAQKFGVNKTTVERAVSELIGEGYLYSKDKSGTYVSGHKTLLAKSRNQELKSLAVIIPNIMSDIYPGLLRGVEDIACETGINVIICNTDNDEKKQNRYIENMISSEVGGLIIIPVISSNRNIEPFLKLKKESIPFIFCNRHIYDIDAPCVCSNNFYGAYIATKRIILQGYRNIAYISRPVYITSMERYQGYMAALIDNGISFNEDYAVFEDDFYVKGTGYNITKNMLENHPEIDGIFAFNDMVATGVYTAVIETGKIIGRDIGVIGYDNTNICDSLPCKLTSVDYKNYEIGAKAAILLKDIYEGKKVNENVILNPELVIRESCSRG